MENKNKQKIEKQNSIEIKENPIFNLNFISLIDEEITKILGINYGKRHIICINTHNFGLKLCENEEFLLYFNIFLIHF